MSIIHTIKDKLYGKLLPCYVIWRKPVVFFSFWEDLYPHLDDYVNRLEKEPVIEAICQLGWHYETEARGERLEKEYTEVMSRLPRLKVHFVTNSPEEEAILRRHGMTADFCHQNAFIDEKRLPLYCPDKREFDAIYLARITPFKRQELAEKVQHLRFVSAWVHPHERDYADRIHAMMPNASFGDKISYRQVSKEMSRAAVGLCLSAEEGAMFVSAEYLLSGLTVVSTKNLGGREWVMPKEYWRRAEDNPDSVAAAVEELVALHADPVDVRAKTLEMFRPHREKMCAILKGIFDSHGLDGAKLSDFDRWFTHKLGLRCTVLPWRRVLHGILK